MRQFFYFLPEVNYERHKLLHVTGCVFDDRMMSQASDVNVSHLASRHADPITSCLIMPEM